jgi:hypothetical protein
MYVEAQWYLNATSKEVILTDVNVSFMTVPGLISPCTYMKQAEQWDAALSHTV